MYNYDVVWIVTTIVLAEVDFVITGVVIYFVIRRIVNGFRNR